MMYDLQIGAIFYSRLLKKNFAIEIIPKGEQDWKNTRKPMGWHLKICKQCTADEEMKGLLRSFHNHRLQLRRWPSARVTTTARILATIVKYLEENIPCSYKIESSISPFSSGEISP